MKKLFLTIFFLAHGLEAETLPFEGSKKLALDIISSLTDKIAALVVNQRTIKADPQVTKECCVDLIVSLTQAILTIVAQVQENKIKRNVVHDYTQEEYEQAMMIIAEELIKKL